MKNLSIKLLNIYNNNFILSRSFLIVAASLFSSIFAYLFQLIAGRYLSVEDYSELVSLFSVSAIITTIILIFTNGTTKLVAEIKSINYPYRLSNFFFSLLKVVIIISLILFIIMIFTPDMTASYLNISNTKLMLIFAIAVFAGNINTPLAPFLQGLQRFKAFSLDTFITSFTKFLAAVVVMALGLSLVDLFVGLIISTIISITLALLLLKKNLTLNIGAFDKADMKTLLSYSLGSILTLAGLNFFQNNDVILVKHYFDANSAGIYASLTVIGRIIFFAASPVAIVMLPICAERYKHGGDVVKPFFLSLSIAGFIAFVGTIIYWALPHLIIGLLFGDKYMQAEPYLPSFAVFMLLYTLIHIVGMFLIAISKFILGSIVLLGALIQLVGISLFHASIYQVIQVSITSSLITLIVLSIVTLNVINTRSPEEAP